VFFYSTTSQSFFIYIIFPQCLQWLASLSCLVRPQCLHGACFFIGRKITVTNLKNKPVQRVIIRIANTLPVSQITVISQNHVVVSVARVKYRASKNVFISELWATCATNTRLAMKKVNISKFNTENIRSLFLAKNLFTLDRSWITRYDLRIFNAVKKCNNAWSQ
jgi:hypothetical protein